VLRVDPALTIPASFQGPNPNQSKGIPIPADVVSCVQFANVPAARLDTLGVDAVGAETDGTTTAIEQARTVLETEPAYPVLNAPFTLEDNVPRSMSVPAGYLPSCFGYSKRNGAREFTSPGTADRVDPSMQCA
jgi:hypothetical protein